MTPNKSSSKDKGPLRHAWTNWKNLQEQVAAFLACDQVKLALRDDEFRKNKFGDPWEKPPEGVDITLIKKMWDDKPIKDFGTLAKALLAMSNQTQKNLAIKKAQTGMRETSQMQEWMNLLLDGETPRGHFEVLDVVIPDTVRTIDGFRIHAVVAIEILLKITKGDLDPEANDPVVTKTHGLHVVGTDQNAERARGMEMTSLIGTEAQLRHGYRYGLDKRLDTRDDKAEKDIQDKVRRRIQGAFFRALQMREVGNETMELKIKEGWRRPNASVSKVILSEVCTGPEISKGTTPTFCRGQWDMGEVVPMNESVDLSAGNISAQIVAAQPHIVSMIVNQKETLKLSTILQGR